MASNAKHPEWFMMNVNDQRTRVLIRRRHHLFFVGTGRGHFGRKRIDRIGQSNWSISGRQPLYGPNRTSFWAWPNFGVGFSVKGSKMTKGGNPSRPPLFGSVNKSAICVVLDRLDPQFTPQLNPDGVGVGKPSFFTPPPPPVWGWALGGNTGFQA